MRKKRNRITSKQRRNVMQIAFFLYLYTSVYLSAIKKLCSSLRMNQPQLPREREKEGEKSALYLRCSTKKKENKETDNCMNKCGELEIYTNVQAKPIIHWGNAMKCLFCALTEYCTAVDRSLYNVNICSDSQNELLYHHLICLMSFFRCYSFFVIFFPSVFSHCTVSDHDAEKENNARNRDGNRKSLEQTVHLELFLTSEFDVMTANRCV